MWEISSASVAGPYHVRNGDVNQDSMGSRAFGDSLAIVAADGAGSLDLSHIGSALAVETTLNSLAEADPTLPIADRLERAVMAAREALWRHPEKARIGCTLAVVLLTPNGHGAAVVGDAFAVLRDADGCLELVGSPPDGEYANQTKFLTSSDVEVQLVSGVGKLSGAAVSTDGLEYVAIQGGVAFPGFWDAIFRWGSTPGGFDVLQIFRRMEEDGRLEDDATLVVAMEAKV